MRAPPNDLWDCSLHNGGMRALRECSELIMVALPSYLQAPVAAIKVDVLTRAFMASTTFFGRMVCCRCASRAMMQQSLAIDTICSALHAMVVQVGPPTYLLPIRGTELIIA